MSTRESRVGAFVQGLREMVSAVQGTILSAETERADELVQEMRSQVEPGPLRDSIRWEQDQRKRVLIKAGGPTTTVQVRQGASPSYDYARANEFGTVKMPAHPFFWSTIRRRAARARGAVMDRAKQTIERTRL